MQDFIRGFPEGLEAKGASQNPGKTKQHLIKLLCPFLFGLDLVIPQALYNTSWKRRFILAEAKLLHICKHTCKCWLAGDPAANNDWGSFCTLCQDENISCLQPSRQRVQKEPLNFFCLRCSFLWLFVCLFVLLTLPPCFHGIHQDTPHIAFTKHSPRHSSYCALRIHPS